MESLRISEDFKDLLSTLNDAGVRYLVIGAFALAHYGFPRYTKDLDLWIDRDPENSRRVFSALSKFGTPLGNTTPLDFSDPDCVFQIGVEPMRIDILSDIDGLSFDAAWANRVPTLYGNVPVFVISKDDYVRNKRASGRASDLRDIATLEDDLGTTE